MSRITLGRMRPSRRMRPAASSSSAGIVFVVVFTIGIVGLAAYHLGREDAKPEPVAVTAIPTKPKPAAALTRREDPPSAVSNLPEPAPIDDSKVPWAQASVQERERRIDFATKRLAGVELTKMVRAGAVIDDELAKTMYRAARPRVEAEFAVSARCLEIGARVGASQSAVDRVSSDVAPLALTGLLTDDMIEDRLRREIEAERVR